MGRLWGMTLIILIFNLALPLSRNQGDDLRNINLTSRSHVQAKSSGRETVQKTYRMTPWAGRAVLEVDAWQLFNYYPVLCAAALEMRIFD